MKKAFATNLRIARNAKGYTQQKTADLLGIKRSTYQAYEEGRAYPSAPALVTIADLLDVFNLRGFICNPDFDMKAQDKAFVRVAEQPMQSNFVAAR